MFNMINQKIVIEKHNTRYVRSATIIDGVYWLSNALKINDIHRQQLGVCRFAMRGRELAMATVFGKEKFKTVSSPVTKDFDAMMIGLGASVAVVH